MVDAKEGLGAMIASGTIVGRYFEVHQFIAEGATGQVYRGFDRKTSRHVAIKFLRAEFSSSDEVKKRFQREAVVAAKIDSPYVARVIDAGDSGKTGRLWIAFELLDGQSLDARLESTLAIAPAEAALYVDHLLQGLAAAHAASVIHRDIKPRNLFVERMGGRLRILDFGVAKLLPTETSSSSGLTRFGEALGTPAYMSPEQLRNARDVDHRTDLYSAGCVAFRLLTGRLPFKELELARLFAAKDASVTPSLARATGTSWGAPIETWIAKSIARRAHDRHATALDALDAWRAACRHLGASADPRGSGAPSSGTRDPLDVDTDLTPPPSK